NGLYLVAGAGRCRAGGAGAQRADRGHAWGHRFFDMSTNSVAVVRKIDAAFTEKTFTWLTRRSARSHQSIISLNISVAEIICVSAHCRCQVTLILQFVRPGILLVITLWYISLPYSGTMLAQQVIALHTELQRPKPL